MFDGQPTNAPCIICGYQDSDHIFTKNGFDIVRCRHCQLVFVARQPGMDEIKDIYSFNHNYHIEFADWGRHPAAEARADRHVDYLQKHKAAGRVLDVGCSAGFFLDRAQQAGWEAFGVELSEDTAAVARHRFGLDVRVGTLADDLFSPGSFDTITLWDVIEHLKDPASALVAAKRLLKDDGILLLETPNIEGLFPRLSYKVAALLDYWPHPGPPYHLFEFSSRTIEKLLEKAGLRMIELTTLCMPLAHAFGSPRSLVRSPKRLAYSLAFAPIAMIGPVLGQGDSLVVAAAKA